MLEVLAMILGGIGAAIVAVWAAWRRGKAAGKNEEAHRKVTDYLRERKYIDETDLGLGATDFQRVERLRGIAKQRGGAGKD